MQSKPKTRFGTKQVLLASLAVLFSSYIAYAAGLASNVIIARALGPEEFGRLAYFVWLTGILVILFNNGITVTLIRFIAESVGENNLSKANSQERWLKKTLWLSIAALGVTVTIAHKNLGIEIPTIPLSLTVILLVLAATAKSLYIFDVSKAKGYGEFNIEPYSSSLLSLSSLVLTGIVYYFDGKTIYFLLTFLAISFLHPVFSRGLLRKHELNTAGYDKEYKPDITFRSHLCWSSLLCIVLLSTNRAVETYLLNAYYESSEVGKFIVAATLARAGLDLVSAGLNAVLMPVLSHGFGFGGQEQVERITQRAVKYMLFLGLLFSGTCYFFANPLVAILYGNSFSDSALAFKILVICGGLTLTSGVFGAYLSTTNKQKTRAIIAISGAIVQGVIAAIVVPQFGLWGAVASTSVGGLIMTILLYFSCKSANQLTLPTRELLTAMAIFLVIITAIIVASHYSQSEINYATQGVLFAILFLALSLIFGIWTKTDIYLARDLFSTDTIGYRLISYLAKYAT